MVWLFISWVLAVAGVVLVVMGLRGRQVDDHPVCRRCRYDLVGAPPGSTRCPECGADTTAPDAMTQGNRQRRNGLIWAGAGGGGVALLVAVLLTVVLVGDIDYLPYAPLSMVVSQAQGGDPKASALAFAELTRRHLGGMSNGDMQWLVDRALDRQGDWKLPWDKRWGEIVEKASAGGQLRAGQWERYLQQAFRLEVAIRPQVRVGDRLPFSESYPETRLGTMTLNVDMTAELTLEGKSYSLVGGRKTLASGGSVTTTIFPGPEVLENVSPGVHDVTLWLHTTIGAGGATVTRDERQDMKLRVLPASEPSVKLAARPELQAAMEKAFSVERVYLSTFGSTSLLVLTVHSERPPMDVSFDVILLNGAEETKLGTITFPADRPWSYGVSSDPGAVAVEKNKATSVELLLRPSMEGAARTVTITEIWDGQIRLKPAKIERP